MTLYLFTNDTPNTSSCYDKCATFWPPLLTNGNAVGGTGVDASKFGTTTRKDGSTQVTYNSWPLYYFAKDKQAGDVTGQGVTNNWYVVSPTGDAIKSAAQASATQAPAAAAPSGPAMVNVGKDAKLGSILVDGKGMTLYLFTNDTPNTSSCYDKCATFWPPLLTSGNAVGGTGVDASKFGTTTRKDGSTQVTYNSWPLYYFAKDKQPGDVTGQGVTNNWYVVSPAGDAMK
jgi:predicted lipoprotein with Yx(FWY)xxD motif